MSDNTAQQSNTSTSLNTVFGRNSPYPGAKPLLDTGLAQLGTLFKNNRLSPYVGMNDFQKDGLSRMINAGRSGGDAISGSIATMRGMAGGAGDVSSAKQDSIYDWMSPIARGDMIGANDPNFEHIVNSATERATTAAKMMAGSRGRYGSDYGAESVARAAGDTEAQLRYNNLEAERARQMSAAGLGLSAANSGTAIQGANQDRRFSAAGAIPGLVNSQMGIYDMIRGAGDAFQDDAFARKMAPVNNLQGLFQMLGYSQPYSSSYTVNRGSASGTGTTKGPDNTLGQILGGGLGIASLFGGMPPQAKPKAQNMMGF